MNTIQILEGGKLSPSYDNVIDFKDIKAQNKYWEGQKLYSRDVKTPIAFFEEYPSPLVLPYSMKEAKNFNYLRINVQVGEDPEFGTPVMKWYYYFILNVKYITPETCSFTLQLDVWQTYMFDYEFYESFIEREHQDRYDKEGNAIFNRMPEDLDLGKETYISDITRIGDRFLWFHIITKTAICIEQRSGGHIINPIIDYRASINGLNQSFFHYLIPFDPNQPNRSFTIKQGNKMYTLEPANSLIKALATSELTISIKLLAYAPISYVDHNDYLEIFDECIIQQPNNKSYIIADDSGTPQGGEEHFIYYDVYEFGKITGPNSATMGDRVALNVVPDEGYSLTTGYATDTNGNITPIVDNSFIMPNDNVTIKAIFGIEKVSHKINVVSSLPDKVTITSSHLTATQDTAVTIRIDTKDGYKWDVTTDVEYVKHSYGITFNMPNREVNVMVNVTEVTQFAIGYTSENCKLSQTPSYYSKGSDFKYYVKPYEGYKLSSNYAWTLSGDKVPGTAEELSDGRIKTTIFSNKFAEPINVQVICIPKEDPKPVSYNIDVKTQVNVGTLSDAGYVKVSPKTANQYQTIRCEVFANYQEDEQTGRAYAITGAIMKTSKGEQLKPRIIEFQDYTDYQGIKHRYKLIVEYTMPADNCIYTVSFQTY